MERYIDADALLEALKSRKLIFEEGTPVEEAIAEQVSVFEEVIEEAPIADVVPKSEVEKIFEEIEKALNLSKCYGESGIYFEHDIEADIAELKKKYTEEK